MNQINQPVDVVVIGAGQAGLASGWHLKRQGLSFLILDEQLQPGGNWRNYYDSLELFSPAAYSSLPGMPFPAAPGHYPARDEVVRYLEKYAELFELPILQGVRATRVDRVNGGFQITAASGQHFLARAVVVASGAFSRPYTPDIPGLGSFNGTQLHSADYRNNQPFGGQRIVVIGAANSAVQIAYDLAKVATVTLATRETIRFVPQRILGADFHTWLKWTGLEKTRWLNDQSTPVLDDGTYSKALKAGDFNQAAMFTQVTSTGIVWPDGQHEAVDSLMFATGFRPNLAFLESLPVLDERGWVRQRDGRATHVPGLYFVGLPKQRNFASATLRGVGPDAEHILRHLLNHLRAPETLRTPTRKTEQLTPE
ncbi:NAD(P)/FAD-dependent oxidoreductase [Pseudomonas sp. SWRI196]|uniref:NAD(P)/FAD-dependent oxidoreductase n=1 Tax=Pseudomonas tehranensis TaxID=2745502 RepID=A0ABR6UKX3_9PSED|nr:NAD(P)-binding domain-containing protein [Pseudomonas tehranensis]MBC3345164.1 NAD(P)/FAD-dependent oxidoreductase [Pseudomonas tehranensis]